MNICQNTAYLSLPRITLSAKLVDHQQYGAIAKCEDVLSCAVVALEVSGYDVPYVQVTPPMFAIHRTSLRRRMRVLQFIKKILFCGTSCLLSCSQNSALNHIWNQFSPVHNLNHFL
jgi:hypothetical protein